MSAKLRAFWCANCHKLVVGYYYKLPKCCSRTCVNMFRPKKIVGKNVIRSFTCKACGKFVTMRGSSDRMYCSLKCSATAYKPGPPRTGKVCPCLWCGKDVYVVLRRLKSGSLIFCDMACRSAYAGRNSVTCVCQVCKKEFKRSATHCVGEGHLTFCSIVCMKLSEEWHIKTRAAGILGTQALCKSKESSSIELICYDMLDALGIMYLRQHLLFSKFTVDAFLPNYNLVIQCDGDYWHGFKGIKYPHQLRRVNLDKSQDAYMVSAGVRVLRFWEHDLKNNKEMVIDTIKSAIQ